MDLVSVLLNLLIIAGIIGLFWLALTQIPLPSPARIVINIILCVIGILFLAGLLTGSYHGIVIAH